MGNIDTKKFSIEDLIKRTIGNKLKSLPNDVQETYEKNPLRLLDSKNKDKNIA